MKKLLLLSLFFSLIACLSAEAISYYISPTGRDASTYGMSASKPYLTFDYALARISAGDTLFVMAGIYTNPTYGTYNIWKNDEAIYVNGKRGTPNAYITIKPYKNDRPKIKSDSDMAIQVRQSSYIRIEGLEVEGDFSKIPLDSALKYQFSYLDRYGVFQNREIPGTDASKISGKVYPDISNDGIIRPSYFNGHGIVVQSCDHIEVINNIVHDMPGEGIRAFSSDYLTIVGNEVYNCTRRSSTGVHGLAVYKMTSGADTYAGIRLLIANNKVHDNFNELFSWSEQKTKIEPKIDEGKGITIQRSNAINGTLYGRLVIMNNLAYRNGFSGVHINDGDRIDIINNTVWNNNITGNGSNPFKGTGNNTGISIQGGTDVTVRNNITVSINSFGGDAMSAAGSTALTVSNNVINGSYDSDISSFLAGTPITSPVLLKDPANNDFSLLNNSPAIGTALKAVAPTTDYFGSLRDNNPDIGAIEYNISSSVIPLLETSRKIISAPSPFSDQLRLSSEEEILQVRIYALTGVEITGLVSISGLGENTVTLSTSLLPKGAYVLWANNSKQVILKK